MAPTSKAVTVKSSDKVSASPYQLDPSQVLRAAKALHKHIKTAEKEKEAQTSKKSLLADEESDEAAEEGKTPVWLIVTTKKHIVDKKRLKPAKVAVPHSMSAPSDRICLITADPQRAYKDLIAHPAFPTDLSARIGRVIGISKLKAKYKTYEARRQLFAEYDMFLADDRIITLLPAVLGKVFYKSSAKRPIPVNCMGNEKVQKDADGKKPKRENKDDKSSALVGAPEAVAKDVQKAVSSALVHLSPSTTTAIRIAQASWEPKMIQENLEAVVAALTSQEKLITKGWRNVRSIHIKGPDTTALPIWLAEELWVDEEDVLDETFKPNGGEGEKESKKRKEIEDVKDESKEAAEKPAKKSKKESKKEVKGDDLSKEIKLRKEKLKAQKKAAMAEA
ncbi:ribosomal protein L1 [Saccharata proteae CBS 121410]|uniref:Ribosomal protein L1 n=1 Tax=Saccharata proteae CBS 121410 TaxID=1314787 RepID=A0A6A5YE67_9PEZI|nr:ribosomal protein L1 [Saccharata proteae CBS 121410]